MSDAPYPEPPSGPAHFYEWNKTTSLKDALFQALTYMGFWAMHDDMDDGGLDELINEVYVDLVALMERT